MIDRPTIAARPYEDSPAREMTLDELGKSVAEASQTYAACSENLIDAQHRYEQARERWLSANAAFQNSLNQRGLK